MITSCAVERKKNIAIQATLNLVLISESMMFVVICMQSSM